jgi:hypothetical protein
MVSTPVPFLLYAAMARWPAVCAAYTHWYLAVRAVWVFNYSDRVNNVVHGYVRRRYTDTPEQQPNCNGCGLTRSVPRNLFMDRRLDIRSIHHKFLAELGAVLPDPLLHCDERRTGGHA